MENVKTEIKKVSIKSDHLVVIYEERVGNDSNQVTKDCGAIIHADLRTAFDAMKKHLVCLCEQMEGEMITVQNFETFDLEKLSNYTITGITKGGSDDSEGVTIVGSKLLKTGKVLNIVSPFTKYEDEYPFVDHLGLGVNECLYEVEQYLFNGKHGYKQKEIDFDIPEEADIKMDIASGIGKASITFHSPGRKKKSEKVPEAV